MVQEPESRPTSAVLFLLLLLLLLLPLQVRIFIKFDRAEAATRALVDLQGRFFGGRQVNGLLTGWVGGCAGRWFLFCGLPGGVDSHRLATHSAIRQTRLPGARGKASPARYA